MVGRSQDMERRLRSILASACSRRVLIRQRLNQFRLGAKGAALLSSAFSRLAVFSGSGGQSGGGSNNGAGAPGGIGVAIECGGTLNFTGTISSQGGAEALGTGSSTWSGWVSQARQAEQTAQTMPDQNYQQLTVLLTKAAEVVEEEDAWSSCTTFSLLTAER